MASHRALPRRRRVASPTGASRIRVVPPRLRESIRGLIRPSGTTLDPSRSPTGRVAPNPRPVPRASAGPASCPQQERTRDQEQDRSRHQPELGTGASNPPLDDVVAPAAPGAPAPVSPAGAPPAVPVSLRTLLVLASPAGASAPLHRGRRRRILGGLGGRSRLLRRRGTTQSCKVLQSLRNLLANRCGVSPLAAVVRVEQERVTLVEPPRAGTPPASPRTGRTWRPSRRTPRRDAGRSRPGRAGAGCPGARPVT